MRYLLLCLTFLFAVGTPVSASESEGVDVKEIVLGHLITKDPQLIDEKASIKGATSPQSTSQNSLPASFDRMYVLDEKTELTICETLSI